MYISGVDYESIADGDGCRCVIFVSGCKHNCPGCHSPTTHDFKAGEKVTPELVHQINEEISKRPFLSGITLSGGDPMYSARECRQLLEDLVIPNNNVWIYSGFTFEEICKNANMMLLLMECDVLVDGPYIEERRDITYKFRGSTNQEIIRLECENCVNRNSGCDHRELCPDFRPMNLLTKIRRETGCPIWAIKMCLELTGGDEQKTIEKLIGIYDVIGDHPEVVRKSREEELRREYELRL